MKFLLIIVGLFAMNAHGETFLTRPALDSTITIASNAHYGGAITSLVFRGYEHINKPLYFTGAEDHGRELQSAVWFDSFGECLNPTQGGSDPRMKIIESSLVRSTYVANDTIYTGSLMGYWLEPGFNYGHTCGTMTGYTTAQNTTVQSNVLLQSNYTLGYGNIKNILTVDATFNVPDFHSIAAFEVATFFTSLDFGQAEYINVTTGATIPATSRYEQNSPIIMYTSDFQHAVGIYSKDSGMRYTWSTGVDSAHEACYFRTTNVQERSAVKRQCQYILGTKSEVESTMLSLKLETPPRAWGRRSIV
jgi:hypothetical protein